jgi:hypothetical protein
VTVLRHDDAWIDAALAAAVEYGVDLSLLVENLRRTPAERLARLDMAAAQVAEIRRAMARRRPERRRDR